VDEDDSNSSGLELIVLSPPLCNNLAAILDESKYVKDQLKVAFFFITTQMSRSVREDGGALRYRCNYYLSVQQVLRSLSMRGLLTSPL
jgi:hypothetical protein